MGNDLPDYQIEIVSAAVEATSFRSGLDADKPASPAAGDIWLARDTLILYICAVAGAWTGFDAAQLIQGTLTLYAALAGGGFKINNIADPTAAQDAATKAYADLFTLLTTFNDHSARHELAGADVLSVAGLAGLLAADQHVLDAEVLAVAAALVHAARHQDLGADEISVTGLSGLLADDQHVLDAEVLAVAAALVHAARHQAAGADVISIAGLAGEPTELTTHKDLTTGVHGVGADYLAKAAGSQYTAVNRAGDSNLGAHFTRAVANDALVFHGGTSPSAEILLWGKDHATYPGHIILRIPNAAKTDFLWVLECPGVTDTPVVRPGVDNQTDLGSNTHRWKLVRAVTVTAGDMKLENGWGFTEHPEHGIVVKAPSGKIYKMNLEEIE